MYVFPALYYHYRSVPNSLPNPAFTVNFYNRVSGECNRKMAQQSGMDTSFWIGLAQSFYSGYVSTKYRNLMNLYLVVDTPSQSSTTSVITRAFSTQIISCASYAVTPNHTDPIPSHHPPSHHPTVPNPTMHHTPTAPSGPASYVGVGRYGC